MAQISEIIPLKKRQKIREKYNSRRRWMFQLTEKERDVTLEAINHYYEWVLRECPEGEITGSLKAARAKFRKSKDQMPIDPRKFNQILEKTLMKKMEKRYDSLQDKKSSRKTAVIIKRKNSPDLSASNGEPTGDRSERGEPRRSIIM